MAGGLNREFLYACSNIAQSEVSIAVRRGGPMSVGNLGARNFCAIRILDAAGNRAGTTGCCCMPWHSVLVRRIGEI